MPADLARIAIARDLLTQLGVTLADLHDGETPTAVVPTLASYLPCVIAAAGFGAKRTYGSYWARMVAVWGARPLDQISASDIEAMQHQMAATARSRRNSRHGEHVIAALAPSTTGPSPTDSSRRAQVQPTGSLSRADSRAPAGP